jgi:hypothetical protein
LHVPLRHFKKAPDILPGRACLFHFWSDYLCFEEFIEQRPIINQCLP